MHFPVHMKYNLMMRALYPCPYQFFLGVLFRCEKSYHIKLEDVCCFSWSTFSSEAFFHFLQVNQFSTSF